MILISIDIDWAPDEVIQSCLDLINSYGLRATVFLTHSTKVDFGNHEVASHPNFLTSKSNEAVLEQMCSVVPGSAGIRSHSLLTSARMQLAFAKSGYIYSSNFFLDRAPQIAPSEYCQLVELPIYFMDNLYLISDRDKSGLLALSSLKLDQDGLKVLVFHPTNIFLNLEAMARHESAKEVWKDVDKLKSLRNTTNKGIRDLFVELLEYLKNKGTQTKTMKEVALEFKNNNPRGFHHV